MKVKINTYPSYKDSGVEWLGEIPEHWKSERLASILNNVAERNRTDLPLLSITREKGVILRDMDSEEDNHNFIPDDLSNYKVLRKGHFGINKMKAWQGSYGISEQDGIVSPAYFIFQLRNDLNSRFFHLAIRSRLYISFFGSASDGVRIGQWDLSRDRMKNILFLIPPLPEQTAIAQYLDEKTALIDKAIDIKQKQIALIKERRQILIHKAVTRGLDPNVKMKDCGVEWIGEIPEGWEVKNLRYAFEFLNNKRIPLSAIEREKMQGDFPYYGASGIIDYIDNYIFDEKLILIGEDGANLLSKSTPLAFVADGKYWVNNHAHILRPLFEGFNYWAEQLSLIDYTVFISGAAQPKLSRSNLSAVQVIVPTLKDLDEISKYIEIISQKIATAISLKEKEIEKLKEYKATLINSAVTGKIKIC